jgi:hypothetical protein
MTDYLVKQQDKVFDSLRESARRNLTWQAYEKYQKEEVYYRNNYQEQDAYETLMGWLWDEMEIEALKEHPWEDEQ